MGEEKVVIQPHPVLKELRFPKRTLITLDITKFDTNSATECFVAVQNALGLNNPMEVIMYEDTDGEDPDGRPIERISYSCPRCSRNYVMPYAYKCPECGQMLKW